MMTEVLLHPVPEETEVLLHPVPEETEALLHPTYLIIWCSTV